MPCVCLAFEVYKNMSELFKIVIDSLFLLYCSVLIPSVASDTFNTETLAYIYISDKFPLKKISLAFVNLKSVK